MSKELFTHMILLPVSHPNFGRHTLVELFIITEVLNFNITAVTF